MPIHPSSIIDKSAKIAPDAEIGPFCTVGEGSEIGPGTRLISHVAVGPRTKIGAHNTIYPQAAVGYDAQDKKAKMNKGFLSIGDDNVIRECVTIHTGSLEGSTTKVGDRNFFMNFSHVGHDCVIGNDVIVTNAVQLGGFVQVEDKAVMGGVMGVHQYVRIGRLAMVGGMSKVTNDVPPFSLCDGNPFRLRGLNIVGLRRAGFDSKRVQAVKKAIKILFMSGLNRAHALAEVKAEFLNNPDVAYLIAFIESSKRGVTRSEGVREGVAEEEAV